MNAKTIAQEFTVEGQPVSVEPTGNGNVNDTYLAVFRNNASEQRFILQKLNLKVFTSPEAVMHNMKIVTEHISARIAQEAPTSIHDWKIPEIIPTRDGHDFLFDTEGDCWRAITLIDSATAYEEIQSPMHAYQAGLVLGQFQRLISDITENQLKDTLPGFHITSSYLATLDKNLKTESGHKRLKDSDQAKQCNEFISDRREWCTILEDAHLHGKLQEHPIHGDPKISNIMISNDSGKGLSMIDLDTVKPGLIHYDFGDCMRSCCNPAGEDPRELDDVHFDTNLCEQITQGYMTFAKEFLTDTDQAYLYDSIRLLTFELGLRFFADHIAGDAYFKTSRKNHNLARATVQFKLCESIEHLEPAIRKIVEA